MNNWHKKLAFISGIIFKSVKVIIFYFMFRNTLMLLRTGGLAKKYIKDRLIHYFNSFFRENISTES